MNKKGITLIEVIVSAFIITLLSAGLFGSFLGTQHLLNRARHRMQALNFAREAIDRLKSNYKYGDTEMSTAGSPHNALTEIGMSVSGEMAAFSTTLSYDVTEPQVDGYKAITVHVNWNEASF